MGATKLLATGLGLATIASAQNGAMTTDAPTSDPCAPVAGFLAACESLTPGFDDLELATQASCLCYGWINTVAYEPNIYDQAFQTCSAYLSSNDPEDFSTITAAYGTVSAPCRAAGNVAEATTTDTYGLADFESAVSSLVSASPGLLSGGSQASATPTSPAVVFSAITGSNSLFPTPGAGNSNNGGVQLTPGTRSGTSTKTGIGGTQLQSTGTNAPKSTAVPGGSAQSTALAANVKANSGLLAGLVAVIAAL